MRIFLAVLILLAAVTRGHAAGEPLKSFVGEFTVVGAPHGAELKGIIPAILASKLDQELFRPVEKKEQAEIEIFGSYALFGHLFTLDATVRSSDGRLYLKAIEQGEKTDDIPGAITRLAAKIAAAVANERSTSRRPTGVMAAPPATVPVTAPPATPSASRNRFREIWRSQPLDGALVGIAPGKRSGNGQREIFVAGERSLFAYRLGTALQPLATAELPTSCRIIGIDSADSDNDDSTEIYLTMIDRGSLASAVYQLQNDTLQKIAGDLPYYFRTLRLNGAPARIYAQEMGMNTDYYGPLAELVKNGATFTTKNPLRLPEGAHIHNVARFTGGSGSLFATVSTSGALNVMSAQGAPLWQSSDRYGGSETGFKRETDAQRSNLGEDYRWVFLQQRLIATPDGALLLPRNEGPVDVGAMRSFNRHSLHLLQWNGSTLQEQFASGQRPGYLADFAYDPETKELLTLEIPQKEGLLAKGRSAISVLTVEY